MHLKLIQGKSQSLLFQIFVLFLYFSSETPIMSVLYFLFMFIFEREREGEREREDRGSEAYSVLTAESLLQGTNP